MRALGPNFLGLCRLVKTFWVPGLLAGPSPATEAEVVEVEAEQLPSGIVGVVGAERSVSFSRFGSSSSIPVGRNGTVAMASDSYDSGGKNKSLKTARRLLEVTSTTEAEAEAEQLPSLPSGFYDAFVLRGIRVVQALQPGTLLCHFTVPSRLLNSGGFLHGGATASLVDLVASAAFATAGLRTRGSPLEMNISYLDAAFADEEIDIEAKVLRAAKAVGVAVVELKKKSGKIIAQARYSKYLGVASSKL